MPSIPKQNASPISTRGNLKEVSGRRRLRSDRTATVESSIATPIKRKSPRRCINSSPNAPPNGGAKEDRDEIMKLRKSPVKRLSDSFAAKQQWNPKDPHHMSAVKEALHVSTVPCSIVCREDEQQRVLDFCKGCIEQEKAGSLYVCGCPGTGKSLSMEKVKQNLLEWARDAGLQPPDVLSVQCTSLATTSEIFSKILGKIQLAGRTNISSPPLQHLQKIYIQKQPSTGGKMTLIIADELDYLITKDRAVLHDLFMLTALPFSRCILIGIANAIDLADRFLPRLQSLNCKPMVITFRAYSKDQILQILQERLMALPYVVFQLQALELCARKVAAASGDMRKALCICRSAIDLVEAETRESARECDFPLVGNKSLCGETSSTVESEKVQESAIVRIDHMALALSRTFRSPAVDTIQSLPQHQQITICSTVKLLRGRKKDTTLGELYKSYLEVCKASLIPAAGFLEFSSMCQVLNDQGLLKLGQSRDDKLRKIALKVDEADVTFALQGVRFFRNCLQQP
ncbi:cell division control protein 6 homolog B [Punica granatum]|uniref:Cell division control protein n=1 Tax=Punica granatum TaxID=22663 RepID=A0A6P8D0U5_PUNGR|nr:cell division control protein 6 homolog B [Punica granatum]